MITKMFAVYDSKALCYGVPFFMPTTGGAVRAFSDLSNDASSVIHRHGSDFVLYEIGSFDDSNGETISRLPFVNLGTGADFQDKRPVMVPPLLEGAMNGGSK